jgi:hypothetical protein
LEEYAGKDVRQEELLSALSVLDRFFGAWQFTHGKPPTAPSNPSPRKKNDACSKQFFVSQREKSEACTHRWGRRRHASDFQSGVRDFRREAGTWQYHKEEIRIYHLGDITTCFYQRIYDVELNSNLEVYKNANSKS